MGDFVMPSLGADMEAGTIVEWRVHPGDVVHRGDVVAVVDTDKSDIEVEVFEDGVVEELLVDEGRSVAVGTLAEIGGPTMAATSRRPASGPPHWLAVERPRPGWTSVVAGSGPDGPSWRPGLGRAAERTAVPERQEAGRRAVGALMARSARDPHYYLASTVDLGPATAWLAERNASRPVAQRLLPAVLFVKATALAARAVPTLNGFWTDGFEPAAAVHVGMAVSLLVGGLVAPACTMPTTRPRRADGRPARPRGAGPGREAAQLGDERPDDHRDEPGRGGC